MYQSRTSLECCSNSDQASKADHLGQPDGLTVQVNEARRGELQALAVRKYLDAMCVYFWAATPILMSLLTFGLFALLGHALTATVVFTSLALFNVLIAPLNSFPWVINGFVEAIVSVRRLQRSAQSLQFLLPA